jgi:hypothetical protein
MFSRDNLDASLVSWLPVLISVDVFTCMSLRVRIDGSPEHALDKSRQASLCLAAHQNASVARCRFAAKDVGQVVTGRVQQFYGRPAGKEKNADHQQRLNRQLAQMCRRYRKLCFPDIGLEDMGSVTDSDATWKLAGSPWHALLLSFHFFCNVYSRLHVKP